MIQNNSKASITPTGGDLFSQVLENKCKPAEVQQKTTEDPRSNVISGDTHRASLRAALNACARIVGRTLGPHGSNTLVRDAHGEHFATKDGYTVLQRLTFVQETATMVLDHVRSVSRAMVRRVGDGSTSAVIMANSLHEAVHDSDICKKFPPGSVVAAFSVTADVLSERIKQSARKLDQSEMPVVASVAANNDPHIGRIVASAYSNYGMNANVSVLLGGSTTTIREEPGYRVLRGMVHDCFANRVGTDGATPEICVLEGNVRVMIYGDRLDSSALHKYVVNTMNKAFKDGAPFVLIAKEYADDVIQTIVKFKRESPGLNLLLIDHAMATRKGIARLGDLAAVLGARVLTPVLCEENASEIEEFCGSAISVRATASETVFVAVDNLECKISREERAEELERQLERVDISNNAEDLADELDEIRARIKALRGTEVTIMVGGDTEQEKKTLQFLIEDSVLALRSAIRSGVVEGMGFTTLRNLQDYRQEIGAEIAVRLQERTRLPASDVVYLTSIVLDMVEMAYRSAAATVLSNSRVEQPQATIDACLANGESFNAVTREFCHIADTIVLNPADTDVEVLRGAMSIVSMLVSSDQTILTHHSLGGGLD